jgi:hypothetical protein
MVGSFVTAIVSCLQPTTRTVDRHNVAAAERDTRRVRLAEVRRRNMGWERVGEPRDEI